MEKVLEQVESYLLYIVLGLFSIFVLANFSAPFVIPKEILLVVGLSLILIVKMARMIVSGTLTFSVGKFDLGVALIAISYFVSTLLRTPNKMEAYLLPGTTTFVLGGAVLYFLINQFDQKTKNRGIIALFVSALALSLTSLLASLNFFSKIPQLPTFMRDISFNPMGGAIPSIVLLVAAVFLTIGLFVKEKDNIKKFFYGASMAVILFGLLSLTISSMPGKDTSPRFVSSQDSWEIAVDSLKRSPLLGVGPANYLTAFNLFRPVTYNQTDLWQVRFTTGSNFYFTLITENGFFGLFAIALLLIAIYRYLRHDLKFTLDSTSLNNNFEKLSVLSLVVLFALLPISPSVTVILFAVLALVSKSEHKVLNVNEVLHDSSGKVVRILTLVATLPIVAGVIAILYFGGKVLSAEADFKKSLDALNSNDAKLTYDLMNSAITKNPRVDRYHASFAQLNLALATSLASKKEVSEADRATISQLVQQSISQGKATVSLNSGRSGNWEILAQIYKNIMPYAQGADQFTVQTYSQAIALDPTNPGLRIALGGVYYALGGYDNAIEVFKLAVLAKPDLPNAHYNLAVTYREKKDYDNAILEMNNVLNLVAKDSEDYKLAKQVLADLEAKKTAAKSVTGSTENLTAPTTPAPSNVKPPIELPNDSTPPATIQ